jgi:hypothetical protein
LLCKKLFQLAGFTYYMRGALICLRCRNIPIFSFGKGFGVGKFKAGKNITGHFLFVYGYGGVFVRHCFGYSNRKPQTKPEEILETLKIILNL